MRCGQRIFWLLSGGRVFEELFNLLCHLGLGPAAKPVCELIAQLAGETMSLQQLKQEIRGVLAHHGRARLTGTVVSALIELGLAGFAAVIDEDEDELNEDAGRRGSDSRRAARQFAIQRQCAARRYRQCDRGKSSRDEGNTRDCARLVGHRRWHLLRRPPTWRGVGFREVKCRQRTSPLF